MCLSMRVCVWAAARGWRAGVSGDYLLPEVGRDEPRCGNLQADNIGGSF